VLIVADDDVIQDFNLEQLAGTDQITGNLEEAHRLASRFAR
jgi:hypothetical protein